MPKLTPTEFIADILPIIDEVANKTKEEKGKHPYVLDEIARKKLSAMRDSLGTMRNSSEDDIRTFIANTYKKIFYMGRIKIPASIFPPRSATTKKAPELQAYEEIFLNPKISEFLLPNGNTANEGKFEKNFFATITNVDVFKSLLNDDLLPALAEASVWQGDVNEKVKNEKDHFNQHVALCVNILKTSVRLTGISWDSCFKELKDNQSVTPEVMDLFLRVKGKKEIEKESDIKPEIEKIIKNLKKDSKVKVIKHVDDLITTVASPRNSSNTSTDQEPVDRETEAEVSQQVLDETLSENGDGDRDENEINSPNPPIAAVSINEPVVTLTSPEVIVSPSNTTLLREDAKTHSPVAVITPKAVTTPNEEKAKENIQPSSSNSTASIALALIPAAPLIAPSLNAPVNQSDAGTTPTPAPLTSSPPLTKPKFIETFEENFKNVTLRHVDNTKKLTAAPVKQKDSANSSPSTAAVTASTTPLTGTSSSKFKPKAAVKSNDGEDSMDAELQAAFEKRKNKNTMS